MTRIRFWGVRVRDLKLVNNERMKRTAAYKIIRINNINNQTKLYKILYIMIYDTTDTHIINYR